MNQKSRGIAKPKRRSRSRASEESRLPQSTTIVYECEICKIQSNSLFQLRDHLKGKRHKMAAYESSLRGTREVGEDFEDEVAVEFDLRVVSTIFFALGVSVVNFLYTFFRVLDVKCDVDVFYF